MEKYDHQLYRRPQMTGQARDEEEACVLVKPKTGIVKKGLVFL